MEHKDMLFLIFLSGTLALIAIGGLLWAAVRHARRARGLQRRLDAGQYPFNLFGVECGEGWAMLYGPLMVLCEELGVQVLQVKEKFGGLRFYVGPAPQFVHDLIVLVERQSYRVCEECGEIGEHRENLPWARTLCDEHYDADVLRSCVADREQAAEQ